DVNTVENPYVEAGNVQPPAGAAFVDRVVHRPGMAYPGGVLVGAFAAVGWPWGGRWSQPDYQHFSATGG
ncbi:MAG TPA: M15 family metallopeptidase, partial [Acidimicrobiia bacterium]|nr:M15 family metallopeptidase [Acidimicrobiia bacterium]